MSNRISNRDLEFYENNIASANGIKARASLLQLTTKDSEILRALLEIEERAIYIQNSLKKRLKEQKENDS